MLVYWRTGSRNEKCRSFASNIKGVYLGFNESMDAVNQMPLTWTHNQYERVLFDHVEKSPCLLPGFNGNIEEIGGCGGTGRRLHVYIWCCWFRTFFVIQGPISLTIFFQHNSNSKTFHSAFTQIVVKWSLWNFANGTIAVLSWHMQHFFSDITP